MRRMGIEALYRRPDTSKPAPGHKIYPYLLRGLVVDRPNQVWAMDITYTTTGDTTNSDQQWARDSAVNSDRQDADRGSGAWFLVVADAGGRTLRFDQ